MGKIEATIRRGGRSETTTEEERARPATRAAFVPSTPPCRTCCETMTVALAAAHLSRV